jgi:excisionase family DNA binding protein
MKITPMPKESISPEGLMTPEELAVRLKVKRSWVYGHADELGAYRLGKYLRFSLHRVLERLEGGAIGRSR